MTSLKPAEICLDAKGAKRPMIIERCNESGSATYANQLTRARIAEYIVRNLYVFSLWEEKGNKKTVIEEKKKQG